MSATAWNFNINFFIALARHTIGGGYPLEKASNSYPIPSGKWHTFSEVHNAKQLTSSQWLNLGAIFRNMCQVVLDIQPLDNL
jgi:hypothetical protein